MTWADMLAQTLLKGNNFTLKLGLNVSKFGMYCCVQPSCHSKRARKDNGSSQLYNCDTWKPKSLSRPGVPLFLPASVESNSCLQQEPEYCAEVSAVWREIELTKSLSGSTLW